MPELDGVRAVVTGSTRGLGEAVARDLVQRGASVVVNGTDAGRCAALAGELGARWVAGSVADEEVAAALLDTCCHEYGGVDVVVNNAGVTRDGMLTRMSADSFDTVVSVHLRGTWLVCREAAKAMRRTGGSIVNVVSGTALYGNLGQSNYAAAKGGILALTRALSLELERSGIGVNAIFPSVMTNMIDPLIAFAGDRADELRPHFGDPADVAPLVAYLASPAAAGVSGQVLGFNGSTLSVWSHPGVVAEAHRAGRWAPAQIAEALTSMDRSTLQPDALGESVLGLLR